MEEIIDLIFDNIIIIIIVVGGLIRLFSPKSSKQEDNRPQQPPARSRVEQQRTEANSSKPVRNPFEQEQVRNEEPIQEELLTIEEHRNNQLARLKKSYQTSTQTDMDEKTFKRTVSSVSTEPDESIELSDKLTKQGLIDSVIMAEVLGAPRALKPYQNITNARRR